MCALLLVVVVVVFGAVGFGQSTIIVIHGVCMANERGLSE